MKNIATIDSGKEILIDFSHETELAYWSSKLNVKPEVIKAAARACCSNAVDRLSDYLKTRNRVIKTV